MSQRTDMLEHDAQLILSLYGSEQAQKKRLLSIEQQLSAEGVDVRQLHQNLQSLSATYDPVRYRCSYQLMD